MKHNNLYSVFYKKTATNISAIAFLIVVTLIASCNQPTAKTEPTTQPPATTTPSNNDNRGKSINSVKAYIDDINSKLKAIDEAVKGNDFSTLSDHAGEIEDIASKIKQEAANFSTSEFELIKRDVSEIQHGGDEIKDAAKGHSHEDIHHAIETLKEHLEQLKQDVAKL